MFQNLTIKSRLILMAGFSVLLATVLGVVGLVGMNKTNTGLEHIYLYRTVPLTELAEVKERLLHARTAIVTGFAFPDEVTKQYEKVNQDITTIQGLWKKYYDSPLGSDEKLLAEKFSGNSRRYLDNLQKAMALRLANKEPEAKAFYFKEVRGAYTPASKDIDALIELQKDVTQQEYQAAKNRFTKLLTVALAIFTIGLVLLAALGVTLIRSVSQTLHSVQQLAVAIAAGQLDSPIDTTQKNEIGAMLRALATIQEAFNGLKIALNGLAAQHAEGQVDAQLDATLFRGDYGKMAGQINELIHSPISIIRKIIYIVQQYAKGDFSMDMDVLPGETRVITEAMDSIKAALLSISNEIHELVAAGVKGNFSKRVDAGNFEFVFKQILTDLNELMQTCDLAFGDMARVSKALAQGDLTETISRTYPGTFGQVTLAINDTVTQLKSLIGEIRDSSDTISTAAKEIAMGNNDLSHRTEEQAASLEETTATTQALTSMVHLNTDYAKQANDLAFSATNIATKGVQVVGEVVERMDSIHNSSRKVVEIIAVIDSIAFQTNILALNAAVEAARAGEQGRGFAVVAEEVRNLAQRVATAASEIKELIGESVEQIEAGTDLVTSAGKTMQEIAGSIRGVTAIMSEITSASAQQTSGIDQVNQAIAQMNEVTQQNAALVEQAAAAAESLEEQTQNLGFTVNQFHA